MKTYQSHSKLEEVKKSGQTKNQKKQKGIVDKKQGRCCLQQSQMQKAGAEEYQYVSVLDV